MARCSGRTRPKMLRRSRSSSARGAQTVSSARSARLSARSTSYPACGDPSRAGPTVRSISERRGPLGGSPRRKTAPTGGDLFGRAALAAPASPPRRVEKRADHPRDRSLSSAKVVSGEPSASPPRFSSERIAATAPRVLPSTTRSTRAEVQPSAARWPTAGGPSSDPLEPRDPLPPSTPRQSGAAAHERRAACTRWFRVSSRSAHVWPDGLQAPPRSRSTCARARSKKPPFHRTARDPVVFAERSLIVVRRGRQMFMRELIPRDTPTSEVRAPADTELD